MTARKRVRSVLSACLGLTIMLCFVYGTAAEERHVLPEKKVQGSTVIRLNKVRGIIPPVLSVTSGHTAIWINESHSLVEIQFVGNQITMACDQPVNFITDVDGSFVSNKIPIGAVASLCLIQKGEYEYVVNRLSAGVSDAEGARALKGKIIVE